MKPIDYEELEPGDDCGAFHTLNGRSFSGIAFSRDPDTGVIVDIVGFYSGVYTGCWRTWSPSGVLLEEIFYDCGTFHGAVRAWHADGTLKSNEYFCEGQRQEPEGPKKPIIDIDLDTMEFVEHSWGWGREPFSPPSFDEFRGLQHREGAKEWYGIEQASGRQAVRVEPLEVSDRTLRIAYQRRSLRFSDEYASRLIQAKILGDVCMDAYRGRVDKIAFLSIPTKLVVEVPYRSS